MALNANYGATRFWLGINGQFGREFDPFFGSCQTKRTFKTS